MNEHRPHEPEHSPNSAPGHALSKPIPASTLTVSDMDSRKLIHRDQGARSYADAFREIRTRLLEMGDERNFVTLVAAVSPRSGGSFVARNLAAAFAFGESMSALLIDCNVRYPAQATAFGIECTRGNLIDYLDDPEHTIDGAIYNTGIPRLQLIPIARSMELGAEYYSSLRMRTMVDSLRSRFHDRHIILDGPAIKGSPDTRILAEMADFVVLVAGSGRDTPAAIAEASSHFDTSKMAGVVFNQLP